MFSILEAQAPAKQTATDTINTLSNRLSTATLLEDRRAAILGLRSFAKLYPASVASGALRDLIAGLRRDGEDPDTLKIVLETLLMLFDPDPKSPEASEDITLWLADEFTQRQDNITALLDLLDAGEFYLRLYSLQLLSQICAARPQRTQESMFTAPLGIPRITSVLEDKREAVRNEALLLLVALTTTSAELQKVVAYENTFDRVFVLIDGEGGLTHGSTIVQDCLSLLSNLLKLNLSNQSYFREMGCITKVAKLLAQVIKEEEAPDGVSEWVRLQRDINLWGLLTVLQLFLVRGSQGTSLSQDAFWKTGVLQRVLQIAFHQTFASNVRARALETCADIIRGNPALQEQFGDLAVPAVRQSSSVVNGRATPKAAPTKSGTSTPTNVAMSNVIESLLDLTLDTSISSLFDVRLAACDCVKAFFEAHNGIRGHVLRRAIEGHRSGDDAVPNILTVLLEPPNTRANSDPYQQWMAAVLLMHLLNAYPDNKDAALHVSESESENDGDEEYEIVTFVQSITSNVVAGVQHPEDERALIGYLMLLSTWLFEDPIAVNDLLGEGSTVQGLISAVKVASPTMPLVAGLCTFLLAIIYEFSTRDSPIPRATLHGVLQKALTREVFIDKLTKLRESQFVRDFEVLPVMSDTGLPEVYFDRLFIEFFKDNFSRFLRAIDREPGFEVSVLANGVQKGVSRELVDSLRAEIEEQKSSLEAAETELVSLRHRIEQEEVEHRRTKESTTVELSRIRNINQSLQKNHEDEVQTLQQQLARQSDELTSQHKAAIKQLTQTHTSTIEQTVRQHEAEKSYLEQRRSGLEREVARHKENVTKQQTDAERLTRQSNQIQKEQQNEIESLHKNLKTFEEQLSRARKEHESQSQSTKAELEAQIAAAQKRTQDAESKLASSTASIEASQNELTTVKDKLKTTEERATKAETALKSSNSNLEKLTSEHTSLKKQLTEAQSQTKTSQTETSDLRSKLASIQTQLTTAQSDLKSATSSKKANANITPEALEKLRKDLSKAQADLKAAEETNAKSATTAPKITDEELEELRAAVAKQKDTQTELDDLLVVFADLEAKREGDKKRLKDLGEEVSEDEDEEGEEEEDGEDEDEEGEEDDVD